MNTLNQTQFNYLINSVYKLNVSKDNLNVETQWNEIMNIEDKMEKQRIYVDRILMGVSNIKELKNNAPGKFRNHAYYLLRSCGGSNPFVK